ncbi:hypothetical protein [Agaribacterium sp. ZY112]|uniref:hypothetical protein n=1 Tax=Agaribacterium sp. ZY112 TaxID=3233574 RepID=UPI0035267398
MGLLIDKVISMKTCCIISCIICLLSLGAYGVHAEKLGSSFDLTTQGQSRADAFTSRFDIARVDQGSKRASTSANAKLHLVPAGEYLNSTYFIGGSLNVSARFDAGEGNVISDKNNGIEFSLRRVSDKWEVISELVINDKKAVGKRRGLSSVSIPLRGILPSPELPTDEFYLLFARFTASNGVTTRVPGIAPIFIVDNNATTTGRKTKITTPLLAEVDELEESSKPFLKLQNLGQYAETIYISGESMHVSAKFNAGEGDAVDKSNNGIGYFLRRVDRDWNIISDIIVYDRSVIGKQFGVSQVLIPLSDVIPSTELPNNELYFLYAKFDSTDGKIYDVPGIAPITIIKNKPLTTESIELGPDSKGAMSGVIKSDSSQPKEIVISSGSISSDAFLYETRSKGRRCEDIKNYSSAQLYSRAVVELILICQAFRSVDKDISIRFVVAPNYTRSLELVRNGSAHMMAESAWAEDVDDAVFYATEPVIKKGEYFKGVYTSEKKLETMQVKTVADLRRYTALTPTDWMVDIKALRLMGVTNKRDVHSSQSILKMIHSGRGDYMLSDFTRQHQMAITDGDQVLYPIQGIKIRLDSERVFLVSRKSDPDGKIFEMLNQGIKNLRENSVIKRAFLESGFTNQDVEDWTVIND